jgi:hypothetical protein
MNGHKKSGGHWKVALGFLGTRIGLPDFSSGGWWCVGGRGAFSGSGVRGVNGLLAVMCEYLQERDSAAGSAAPSEEQTTVGRIVPLYFAPYESIYNSCIFGNRSLLHRI